MTEPKPEPWLRGTLAHVPAIERQVLHALELAAEDAERWCANLSGAEVNQRPGGIAPVAYHLRHIARSLDRLLTYAEGKQLSETQLNALTDELAPEAETHVVMHELRSALAQASPRMRAISPETFEQSRAVGRKHLPTTVGGLLVHCAEHTQRHIGQAITTAQIVTGSRNPRPGTSEREPST